MSLSAAQPQATAAAPAAPDRTADILLRMAAPDGGQHISLGEIAAALGDRAFGVLLLVLVLPNCIVGPPGYSIVSGLLMAFFAAQAALGLARPRLPAWVERRSLQRRHLHRVVGAAVPHVRRFEAIARPRFDGLLRGRAACALAAYVALQALNIAQPVPFTNWLPSMSIAIIAAGLIERDGAAVLLGVGVGVAALANTALMAGGFFAAASLVFAGLA
jgi:hypothetical protein